jgi:hypothetical protein
MAFTNKVHWEPQVYTTCSGRNEEEYMHVDDELIANIIPTVG